MPWAHIQVGASQRPVRPCFGPTSRQVPVSAPLLSIPTFLAVERTLLLALTLTLRAALRTPRSCACVLWTTLLDAGVAGVCQGGEGPADHECAQAEHHTRAHLMGGLPVQPACTSAALQHRPPDCPQLLFQ